MTGARRPVPEFVAKAGSNASGIVKLMASSRVSASRPEVDLTSVLSCSNHHQASKKCTRALNNIRSPSKSLPFFSVLLKRHRGNKTSNTVFPICCSQAKVAVSESNQKSGMFGTDLFDRLANLSFVEFKMSDFELCTSVSIGLAGKGDEVVYEAIVQNPHSPLVGMKVVLRQLAGPRAKRWGKRAIQVVSKLVKRVELYKSYATQIHGYILPYGMNQNTLTLVHRYYDNYSLHHWLLCEDWLPTLESRLALDEECARRVGDVRTGGPAISRQLRLTQILMRDLLIGVNYLHSHGFAHTELRLQNVQISEADRHIKVGLLGNASDFEDSPDYELPKNTVKKVNRRQLMIAYDIRCVGIMMARMVLRELMDPSLFDRFKTFLTKGNDPSGLRNFLVPIINQQSPLNKTGLQIMDRNGGAGWNLLSLMLASKPSDRISCTEALRHRFLCGPKWRVESSVDMTRWSIGSTAVRIVEEYIYGVQQRSRLAQLIHVLELLNPNTSPEGWVELLPGKWRLVYHTGRHIGLTWRQASPTVLIGDVSLICSLSEERLVMTSNVKFAAMPAMGNWLPNKSGTRGTLEVICTDVSIRKGERSYHSEFQTEVEGTQSISATLVENFYNQIKGRGFDYPRETKFQETVPASLPVVRLDLGEIDVTMELDYVGKDSSFPLKTLREVRIQIPPESFDLSSIVCGTYIDSRLLVLRGVSGAALFFLRSPKS